MMNDAFSKGIISAGFVCALCFGSIFARAAPGPGAASAPVGTPVTIPEPSFKVTLFKVTRGSGADKGESQLFLNEQIARIRSKYGVPALAGALVEDGIISVAAVSGVRRVDQPERALLNDPFMLKSCTKPLTGMLLAKMIDLGQLRWDTKISDVYPEFWEENPDLPYRNTTVGDLMDHTSGMPVSPTGEPDDEYASNSPNINKRRALYVADALKDIPTYLAGDQTIYSGGSVVVASMIERLSQRTWESLILKYLFKPLDAVSAGFGTKATLPPVAPWSHKAGENGGFVPWTPPEGYSVETHAPAGRNPRLSVIDAGKIVAANLLMSKKRPPILSEGRLRESFLRQSGESVFTQSGWGFQSTEEGLSLAHNGSDGKDYSFLDVRPDANYGFAAFTNSNNQSSVDELLGVLQTIHRYRPMLQYREDAYPAQVLYASPGPDANSAEKALDQDLPSYWEAASGVGAMLEVDLGMSRSVDRIVMAEDFLANDITGWEVKVRLSDAGWKSIANGSAVGAGAVVSFGKPVVGREFKFVVTSSKNPNRITLSTFWLATSAQSSKGVHSALGRAIDASYPKAGQYLKGPLGPFGAQ